jgi:D-sedoheptulose 7-phosphate isomerase
VIRGLQEARDRGLVTIGMTGGSGGRVDKIVDHWIHVGDDRVPRVQEAHITIAHIICELVEEAFSSDAGVEDSG